MVWVALTQSMQGLKSKDWNFSSLRRRNLASRLQHRGNSLAVQWLGLCVFTAEGWGSIPGRGTKIPQATCSSQKKKSAIT